MQANPIVTEARAACDRRAAQGGPEFAGKRRNAVTMSQSCKFLKIQHRNRRIGNGFTKNCLCIWTKSLCKLFFWQILIHKGTFNSHLFHRNSK